MCEINAIIKMGKRSYLDREDEIEFIDMLEEGGVLNNDAWGYFTPTFTAKYSGNHISQNLKINFEKDWFVIGHNRFATGGDPNDNENNHPFWNDNYAIVHNGIITNVDDLRKEHSLPEDKIKTDSYIILELIEKFGMENDYDTEINLEKVISLLEGSFSIIIYDKKKDVLYYVKDDLTEINVSLMGNNIICISTLEERQIMLYNKKKIFNFFDFNSVNSVSFDDYHIYKITRDRIKDLGEVIEHQEFYEEYAESKYYNSKKSLYFYTDDALLDRIGEIFNLSEDIIEDLLIDMENDAYCNLSGVCRINPEECPIIEIARRLNIRDFDCPKEYNKTLSLDHYTVDK